MRETLVELKLASKYYKTDTHVVEALRRISLKFERGEFVAVTGESGSGKSTLLRAICGLIPLDDGDLFLHGESCFSCSPEEWNEIRRREIGMIWQDYKLIEHYTVMDNVIMALRIAGMEENAQEKAVNALCRAGLKDYENHKAGQLSSGQKQRLAIARAVAVSAPIILADEPTGNLDHQSSLEILRLLRDVAKDSLVIMVTHDFAEAQEFVSRKVTLRNGQVMDDVRLQETNGSDAQNGDKKQCHKTMDPGKSGLQRKTDRKDILYFAWKNIRGHKVKTGLILLLMMLVAVISYGSIGEIQMFRDDRIARVTDDSIFGEQDRTRLLVKRSDGSAMGKTDLEEILKQPEVVAADLYGAVNEIEYTISSRDQKGYMKSVYVLKKQDIKEGTMAEKTGEIVVSRGVGIPKGGTVNISFQCRNYWGRDETLKYTFRVAGISNGRTPQVYFSDDFCEMLYLPLASEDVIMNYGRKDGKYLGSLRVIPFISDVASGAGVALDDSFQVPASILYQFDKKLRKVFVGTEQLEMGEKKISVQYTKKTHSSTSFFLGVSEPIFRECYGDYGKEQSGEISVYIKSYNSTDRVIRSLRAKGYDGVSTYRVSKTEYDPDRLQQRMNIFEIMGAILGVMFLVQILVHMIFYRIRRPEEFLMQTLGITVDRLLWIEAAELILELIPVLVLGGIVVWLLHYNEEARVMLDYYTVTGAVCVLLYNVVCVCASWLLHCRFYKKWLKRQIM